MPQQVESTFKQLLDDNFKIVTDQVVELFNEKPEKQQYYFKRMITPSFSPDNSFASTDILHSLKAADVVSMDSSLPLKSRDRISAYIGELPKIGMKMKKNERDVRNLMSLIARGTNQQAVLESLFNDVPTCIEGVYIRAEIMFLQAMSTGLLTTPNPDNNGTAIRVDYGYKTSHKKSCAVDWRTAQSATPITDIRNVIEAAGAEGYQIKAMSISKKFFNYLCQTNEAKMFFAQGVGLNPANASSLVTPLSSRMAEMLGEELGLTINIIDSTLRVEQLGGRKQDVSAWKEENVVFTQSTNVGRLVYGTSVEEERPVAGVNYTKADSYILMSMYGQNDPFAEFTSSQAFCLPVIDNPSSIFVLDAKTPAQ